jgi:hypothetical protein
MVEFQDRVKILKVAHTPAKKIGEVEHDIESLNNASGNLNMAVLKLAE